MNALYSRMTQNSNKAPKKKTMDEKSKIKIDLALRLGCRVGIRDYLLRLRCFFAFRPEPCV